MSGCIRRGLILIALLVKVNVVLAAPATDLHINENSGVGAGINGSLFEFAEQLTIPAGQTWRVTGVKVGGFASPGPFYTVRFFTNSSGSPSTTECERFDAEAIGELVPSISRVRDPVLRLDNPCVLSAGGYFVGVTSTSGTTGGMSVNTSTTLIGSESLIRGSGCSSFIPISSCISTLDPQELQFRIRGCQDAACEFALNVLARCSGNDLQIEIRDGDLPLELTGSGPGLPATLSSFGLNTVNGPGLWQSLVTAEQAGDMESISLPTLNCGPRSVTLVESDGSTEVDEAQPGVPDTYTVVLDSSPDPGETVTITASSDTTLGVTTMPPQVQFDSVDWSGPKTIDAAAVDDDEVETPVHTDTITHTLSSTGGVFDSSIDVPDVTVDIVDNDVLLEVEINQPGFALVESTPAGISCPGTCMFVFDVGSTVELSFNPVSGGQLFGWSGACTGTGLCSVTMDGPNRVVATVGAPDALFVNGFE